MVNPIWWLDTVLASYQLKKHTNYRVNVCKNACFFLVGGEDWGKSDTSFFISFRLKFFEKKLP